MDYRDNKISSIFQKTEFFINIHLKYVLSGIIYASFLGTENKFLTVLQTKVPDYME